MDNEKSFMKRVAELTNNNMMLLILLLTIFTLSVGLYFYFVIMTPAGIGIGITMFVVASIIFVIGELSYLAKLKRIRNGLDE